MFKIGDKVRCITPRDNLKTNIIYTVERLGTGLGGRDLIYVKEDQGGPFYVTRFTFTDLDYASLTPTIRKIRELTIRYNIKQEAKRAAI